MTLYVDPPWAYVPGKTPRHAEGAFDDLKEGLRSDALFQSDAWKAGLQYLNSGFFWEAHELFEPVWLRLPAQSPQRFGVQVLIQLANAQLKREMNRPNAVIRLCDQIDGLIPKAQLDEFGISKRDVQEGVASLREWADKAL